MTGYDVTEPALPERMPLRHQPLSSQYPDFYLSGDTLVINDEKNWTKAWQLGGARPEAVDLPADIPAERFSPVAATPDGRFAILVSDVGHSARVVERSGKQFVARQTLPITNYRAASISADGKLAAWIVDGFVKLYDLTGAKASLRIDKAYPGADHLHLAADGKTLAALVRKGATSDIEIWDIGIKDLAKRCVVEGRGWQGMSPLLSPDGRTVLFGVFGVAELWNVARNPPKQIAVRLPEDLDLLVTARYLANPSHVVLAGASGKFGIWDLDTGAWKWHGKLPGRINRITATPDGRYVITGNGNGTVYVFRTGIALPTPMVTADPDRRAAEWVLSIGGYVVIRHDGREGHMFQFPLPKDAFELRHVILAENKKLTAAGLSNLKDCKNLVGVSLFGSAITDTDLASLSNCRELTGLDLHGTQVGDAGLAHFKDCHKLTHVGLAGTKVGDAGLANLKDCKDLIELNLYQTKVTDAGLANLKDCKKLVVLFLFNTKVSDVGFLHLKGCKELKNLSLAHTAIGDSTLELCGHFSKLSFLEVVNTKVTEQGVKKLAKALPDCKITWDGGVIEPTSQSRFTNSLGMEFALVPKGKAWLGGGGGKVGTREVEVKDDFYLGVHEVTQEAWQKVMGKNPSYFSRAGAGKDAIKDIADADLKRFPVENVSWDDAQAFLDALNRRDKKDGWVYRLPTEAEWEYACRGGPLADKAASAFDFYFLTPTNELQAGLANFAGNGPRRPCKVGSYLPNALGLHDMHGNVWEWCADEQRDPRNELHRVFRGGAWSADAASGNCRATGRSAGPPVGRAEDRGLRLARVRIKK
ncbi:MAG: hypothetical protein FJ271_16035 [Planctomycetes bacterium]|nr:hypothetical protein [Planctomycetota bacterium]